MRGRAALAGEREAVADLDALHGLDPHQRGGQPCVEPLLARRVRAEAREDALRAHLDDPAERVAVGTRRVDRGLVSLPLAADLEHRPGDGDAELREQRLRDRPCGDEHRRVPRARALERVADVFVPELEHAGEVGVARAAAA